MSVEVHLFVPVLVMCPNKRSKFKGHFNLLSDFSLI